MYIYGLHFTDPVLDTIKDTIGKVIHDTRVYSQMEKHGEYVTKIKLGGPWSSEGDIFFKGSSFVTTSRGKIMLNLLIEKLLNVHSYRPGFATDLSRYNDRCSIYFERTRLVKKHSTQDLPHFSEFEVAARSQTCCLSLSDNNKLVLCAERHNWDNQLKQCLEEITKEHIKKDFRIEERNVIEKTWVIAEVVIDWDLWGPAASSEAKIIGRLLVSRLTLHFGRQHGWHYLINGNIKDDADYIFYVKSYDAETIIPPGFIPFNGYDTPKTSDAYAIMLCGNDRLRMVNFNEDMHLEVERTIIDFGWLIEQITAEKFTPLCYEFQLAGYPWWTNSKDAVKSRMLIMKIIVNLLAHGYRDVIKLIRGLT